MLHRQQDPPWRTQALLQGFVASRGRSRSARQTLLGLGAASTAVRRGALRRRSCAVAAAVAAVPRRAAGRSALPDGRACLPAYRRRVAARACHTTRPAPPPASAPAPPECLTRQTRPGPLPCTLGSLTAQAPAIKYSSADHGARALAPGTWWLSSQRGAAQCLHVPDSLVRQQPGNRVGAVACALACQVCVGASRLSQLLLHSTQHGGQA